MRLLFGGCLNSSDSDLRFSFAAQLLLLLPWDFLLLAGEEVLEVSGALFSVSLGALSQQHLADLRNSSFFCGRNLLKPILKHGVDPHTEEYLPCHAPHHNRRNRLFTRENT